MNANAKKKYGGVGSLAYRKLIQAERDAVTDPPDDDDRPPVSKCVEMLQKKKGTRWVDVARLVTPDDIVGARAVVHDGISDMGWGTYRIMKVVTVRSQRACLAYLEWVLEISGVSAISNGTRAWDIQRRKKTIEILRVGNGVTNPHI